MERDAGLSRRDLLRLAAVAAGLVVVRGPAAQAALPGPGGPPADEVLQRTRFSSGSSKAISGS